MNTKPQYIPLILLLSITTLTGCSEPNNTAFTIYYNEHRLETCPSASYSSLAGGGYRIDCSPETEDIYMIYDTETGTIKNFIIPPTQWAATGEPNPGNNPIYLHLFGPDAPQSSCPQPNLTDGQTAFPPIPQSLLGNLQPGTYLLDLAEPCGLIKLEIG